MTPKPAAAIASYVTDMVALEHHLEKALAGQISDLDEDQQTASALRTIHATCEQHISVLESLADRREELGQGFAEMVKKAASSVLGAGAAAVDFVRTEKLPKNLRDDYTAVSLASIGYVMLHTTALSLGDDEVAEIAHKHLQNHAKSVMTLHNIIPGAVIAFLQEEGYTASRDVLSTVARNLASVWRDDSGVPDPDDRMAGRGSTRAGL
ncbi:MAG: hypothetical protein ABIZ91_17490 [Gemmatimonadaceae bacterium]